MSRHDRIRRDADALASEVNTEHEQSEFADTPGSCPDGRTHRQSKRPTIVHENGELHNSVRALEQALARHGGIYRRGNTLARLCNTNQGAGLNHDRPAAKGPEIAIVDTDFLMVLASEVASWIKPDKRTAAGYRRIDPPAAVVRGVIAEGGDNGQLPDLMAVSEIPLIARDGRCIAQRGYDPKTGIYIDLDPDLAINIIEAPSRKQAIDALTALKDIVAEFPFEDEASRSVVLAAFLTPFVRPLLRSSPIFAFNAHKMGSGKTLLATIASLIATGRDPYLMTQGDDPEGERKRLLALLIEGAAVSVIDNVSKPLRSDALCTISSEPFFKDRLLGASKMITVPTCTTLFVTGNNLLIQGDLSTRVLMATLDPMDERPEERRFAFDPRTFVLQNRQTIIEAALTVIRGYIVAKKPVEDLPVFGRFEQWSALCREPLVWLDQADPLATRRKIEERDSERMNLEQLLRSWHALFGESPQTVACAVSALSNCPSGDSDRTELYLAFREVCMAVAEFRGDINHRRLGHFVSRHERRWEGGLRFVRDGSRQRATKWRVTKNNSHRDEQTQG